jgi:hypothetical protein
VDRASLPVSLNSYFVVAASVVWHLERQYDLDTTLRQRISRESVGLVERLNNDEIIDDQLRENGHRSVGQHSFGPFNFRRTWRFPRLETNEAPFS